jgi:nucleoside-diphosphate-sugar epimerase
LLAEKLIECTLSDRHPIRAAVPRIVGAYGPHQDVDLATGSAIPVFIRRAVEYPEGKPFVVRGTGRETRSYCYVDDVVEALLLSVEKLTEQTLVGPVNIGSGGLISIAELAETVIRVSGKKIEITYDPSEPTVIWRQAVDCSYAQRLLGWNARVSLENGLRASFRDIAKRLRRPEAG